MAQQYVDDLAQRREGTARHIARLLPAAAATLFNALRQQKLTVAFDETNPTGDVNFRKRFPQRSLERWPGFCLGGLALEMSLPGSKKNTRLPVLVCTGLAKLAQSAACASFLFTPQWAFMGQHSLRKRIACGMVVGPVQELRCFLLATVAGGFLPKRVLFAADGQAIRAELPRLRQWKAPRETLGVSTSLLCQAHACEAQAVDGEIARLSRDGLPWDRTAVAEHRSKLLDLPPGHAGLRRGRLQRLLQSPSGRNALERAGQNDSSFCSGLRGCGGSLAVAARLRL